MESTYDDAVETYRKVLSLNPSHRETHKDLGIAYWQKGEPELALESLRRAYALGLSSVELHYHLGLAFDANGWPGPAEAHFQSALELGPPPKTAAAACAQLGFLRYQRGALKESLESLRKAVGLAPGEAQTCLHIALIHDEQNRLTEAAEWYGKALALGVPAESSAAIHARAGLVYLALGLVEEAYGMAHKALCIDAETPLAHSLLGAVFLANGFYSQAVDHLEEQCRLSPEEAAGLHHLGLAQQDAARAERENIDCQIKLSQSPDDPALLVAMGQACIALGRHTEAVRMLEKAIELGPRNAQAHYHLARAFSAQGSGERALVCFQRYLEFSPANTATDWLNLGCIQARRGKDKEALLAFERAVALAGEKGRLEPWNGASYTLMGRAYARQNLPERAVALFKKALGLRPDDASTHAALAAACIAQGAYREALDATIAANRLTAGRDRTSLTLAECYRARGESDKAIQTARERLRLEPSCLRTYLTLGESYLDKSMYQEAIGACQNFLAMTPEAMETHCCVSGNDFGRRTYCDRDWLILRAHACLGSACAGLGRWDEAIASFKKVVDSDPRDARSWYRLGGAYEAKGLGTEAAECFRKADELRRPGPLGNDGGTGPDSLDLVISGIKEAAQSAPNNFESYKMLGAAYTGKGLPDEAVYYLKKALKLRPSDPDVILALGLEYEAKGEEASAFAMYEKAVALHPENPAVCGAAAQRFLGRRAYDKAIRCYRRVANAALQPPDAARMHAHLGEAYQARREYAEAIAHYEWLVREGPVPGVRAYRELALCCLAAQDYPRMLQYAAEALSRDPLDAGLRRSLADHHFGRGEYDEAMPHYQTLLDQGPAESEVLARLAEIHLRRSEELSESAP